MPSVFESDKIAKTAKPLEGIGKRINLMFPTLTWDLQRAGLENVKAVNYIAIVLYVTLSIFLSTFFVLLAIMVLLGKLGEGFYLLVMPFIASLVMFFYFMLIPKLKITQRGHKIDEDLGYILKDMEIQTNAGTPLFDSIVNIAGSGYGECSREAKNIVTTLESGKSLIEALDDAGMASPSEYWRRTLWQLVNAIRAGGDVSIALRAISQDLQREKESKIKAYAQELNMWGLLYMLGAVVLPSMGVTLLVILSSFMGAGAISEKLFWAILVGLIIFQVFFITFIKGKRPKV